MDNEDHSKIHMPDGRAFVGQRVGMRVNPPTQHAYPLLYAYARAEIDRVTHGLDEREVSRLSHLMIAEGFLEACAINLGTEPRRTATRILQTLAYALEMLPNPVPDSETLSLAFARFAQSITPHSPWSEEDALRAHDEGWTLTQVFGDPELLEIQRLDYPDGATLRWSNDERALHYVRARSQHGSEMHQRALVHHERCAAAVTEARGGYDYIRGLASQRVGDV